MDLMLTLQQRVLTRNRLRSLISQLNMAPAGLNPEGLVTQIRENISVTPAYPDSAGARKRKLADSDDTPGFFVSFTASDPQLAQRVCAEITSMLLSENLKLREQAGQKTTGFLSRQLEQAKHNLDDLDQKLAEFKTLHLGRLPSDVENNLRVLAALDSQLDASTQALSRAQQDKSFTELLLNQQTSAWRAAQQAPNLASLKEELVVRQNQLVTLQSHYTEDHPDVLKTKGDIVEIERQLKGLKTAGDHATSAPNEPNALEPREILQLREQAHLQDVQIDRAMAEQERLKGLIDSYQGRLALSPEIEEQYKQLTRDTETAHKIYDGLLINENTAEMQTAMEREQQGEQLKLLEIADLPRTPSFPVHWMFAAGGASVGLAAGLAIIVLFELQDKSIRSENDVAALLDLPMLASVPWVPSPASETRRNNGIGGGLRPSLVK